MKIVLVSPYDIAYPGGVNAHILHLQEHFLRAGHTAKILAPSSKSAATLSHNNVLVVGKPLSIPASGSIARITLSPLLAPRVKAILNQEQFDIVHIHEPLVPALPITVLRFSQAVNLGTFHAYHKGSRGYRLTWRLLKRWFRRLHGKIAVSEPARQFVSRYFPGYYKIIPNGIEVSHFATERPPLAEFLDGRLNILFVGRFEKRKGLNYLLEAYRIVKDRFPDSRLIVVGPDAGREPYQYLVEDLRLPDVVFVGFVPNEELPRYYQAAHVFCAPATGEESFGIVLLEAMAASRPVVASDIQGYNSVVRHNIEGLLVPPKDPEALAQALGKLLGDPQLRRSMGARGHLRAEEYDWTHIASRVLDYYQSLLEEVRGTGSEQNQPEIDSEG